MTDAPAPLDVWAATLDDVADTDVDRYRATLDTRELARVDRLRRDIDKRHYIVAHGILRAILGRYVGVDADAVEFGRGPHGKPCLTSPVPPELGARGPVLGTGNGTDPSVRSPRNWGLGGHGGPIEFNMSDSGGLLLVAVADVPVGVDIEKRRPMDVIKFARRFFTESEANALEALPEVDRETAFFRAWTCKEAYVKGWGVGISHVGTFDIRVGEARSGLLTCPFDPQSPSHWSLVNIDGLDNFAATVAIRQPGVETAQLRWWGMEP